MVAVQIFPNLTLVAGAQDQFLDPLNRNNWEHLETPENANFPLLPRVKFGADKHRYDTFKEW
jgi:hypothetical protein